MNQYRLPVEIRWSDLDPNVHLRHSVYYDYGAFCRIQFLASQHITAQFMHQHHFGPIIFREECVFKKEIRLNDRVFIDLRLAKSKQDCSRWTMQHQIFKNDEILAAVITLEGAWIDTVQRKLVVPPVEVRHSFEQGPKVEGFTWTP